MRTEKSPGRERWKTTIAYTGWCRYSMVLNAEILYMVVSCSCTIERTAFYCNFPMYAVCFLLTYFFVLSCDCRIKMNITSRRVDYQMHSRTAKDCVLTSTKFGNPAPALVLAATPMRYARPGSNEVTLIVVIEGSSMSNCFWA